MGTPESLRSAELDELHAASMLRAEPCRVTSDDTGIHVTADLPRHGVAAVTVELAGDLPWVRDG
jgi:hypothetical protein